jgi:hypothetical protein
MAGEVEEPMFSFSAIIAKIEGAEHTFMGWMVKGYQALYKNEPTIEKVVDMTVSYAEPALVIVLDAAGGGAAAPEVTEILNEAAADLKVVSALIYDFGPTPTAASIAQEVKDNLASLETAGHIKDPVTLAKLQLIIKTVGTLATALVNAVAPQPVPAPAA